LSRERSREEWLKNARRTLVAALFAVMSATASQAETSVAWRDWDSGLQEARRLDRPILVDVYTQWCGWCKRMDRDVYARPAVRDYLASKFVTIKIDAEAAKPAKYEGRDHTSRSLAALFRVTGYPTTLFLRADGKHLVNVPGYVEADNFLLVLRYVGDGYLDRGVTWEDFRGEAKP
jgi:thioredoxin-related protein